MKKNENLSQSELNIQEALRQAAIADGYELLKQMDELRSQPEYRIPPEANQRMERVIDNGLEHKRKQKKRILAFILVAALLAASAVTVTANWAEIYQIWINKKNGTAAVGTDPTLDLSIDWSRYHLPAYLPKGYVFIGGKYVQGGVLSEYKNSNGDNFTLFECPNGCGCTMDGDNQEEMEIVSVGMEDGLLSRGKNTNTLTWKITSIYVLQGNLEAETLICIAESIQEEKT